MRGLLRVIVIDALAMSQMLEAVQAVHDQNVVHTDLKPANFVLVKGKLKIIDFGIAKAIANDTVNIHRDTQVRPNHACATSRTRLKLHSSPSDRYRKLHVARGHLEDEQC